MHVHTSLSCLLSLALPFPSLRSKTQDARTRLNEYSLCGCQIRTTETERVTCCYKEVLSHFPAQLGKRPFPVFHIQSNPFQLPSNCFPSSTSDQNPFQSTQLTSASAPSWAARSSSRQSSSSGPPPRASCSPSRSPPPQTRTNPPPRPS
jgi:hypothetical protein